MAEIYEVVLQLIDTAGDRQVDRGKIAFTQNASCRHEGGDAANVLQVLPR